MFTWITDGKGPTLTLSADDEHAVTLSRLIDEGRNTSALEIYIRRFLIEQTLVFAESDRHILKEAYDIAPSEVKDVLAPYIETVKSPLKPSSDPEVVPGDVEVTPE